MKESGSLWCNSCIIYFRFIGALWNRLARYAVAHKVLTAIAVLVIVGAAYTAYGKMTASSTTTRYVLGTVQKGTVIATVSGSGQVSPSHQVTINPKAGGQITRVFVQNGAQVQSGQAIASIDATDQIHTVDNAKADLQSAELSLQKIQEPADDLTLAQDQNALSQANASLAKDYDDGYNEVASSFADLPAIMTGVKNILYNFDRTLGASNNVENVDYYANQIVLYDSRGDSFRDDANAKYNKALDSYNTALDLYKATPRTAATSSISKLTDTTYETTKEVADAIQSANSLIQLYKDAMTAHGITPISTADTHISSLNTYTSQLSSHIANLNNVRTSFINDSQSITEKSLALQKLQNGADPLDVQSSQLSVQQKQNALQQAEDNLADYTIRAPFSGTLADFAVQPGDTVTTGTSVATLITQDYIADLSLNEVDAAKVAVGQKATLTFDAIDGLSITGDVVYVSPLGSVSQGVVSYEVKIDFATQDPRVKAGMTVNADIQTQTAQDVLVVPSTAVKTVNGQSVVSSFNPALTATGDALGVVSNTAPQSVPVTIGISDDTNTQILSGLTNGEQIVVSTRTGSSAVTTGAAAGTRTSTGAAGGARGGNGVFLRGL